MVSEEGAVLVETLVAAMLATLLIGFFLQADLAVNQTVLRWVGRSGLQQLTISIRQQLACDFANAESIGARSDYEFTLTDRHGVRTEYDFRGGRLRRNGQSLLPENVSSEKYKMTPLTAKQTNFDSNNIDFSRDSFVLTLELVRTAQERCTIVLPVRRFRHRQIQ